MQLRENNFIAVMFFGDKGYNVVFWAKNNKKKYGGKFEIGMSFRFSLACLIWDVSNT